MNINKRTERKSIFNESHYASFRVHEGGNLDINVFVNPTKMELEKVSNGSKILRFTADPTNHNLYVFTARVIHNQVEHHIEIKNRDKILSGAIEKNSNSTIWKYYGSDYIASLGDNLYNPIAIRLAKELVSSDWTWLEKYFDINGLEKQLGKLQDKIDSESPTIKNYLTKKKK
jgi:hypothetical protein